LFIGYLDYVLGFLKVSYVKWLTSEMNSFLFKG